MFESINSNGKPISERIADEITKLIVDRKLKAGDKLPNEMELANSLKVARSSVREAVKILISRNIVEIKRGCGTYVSGKLGVVNDPFGFSFIADKKKLVFDALEVRYMIEPKIASIAAKIATQEDIDTMEKLCNEVEELILKGQDHTEKDIEFHSHIAYSTRNLVVTNLLPVIDRTISMFIEITEKTLKKETIETHRNIVEAIKQHNPESAFHAMEKHLDYNKQLLESLNFEKDR